MIPFISLALLSWRQLCAMYLAHFRSFKAELMLSMPSLQIFESLLVIVAPVLWQRQHLCTVLKGCNYIAYIGCKILAKERLLDIKVAIGLILMAIFENYRQYDLLSQMGHNDIIDINRKGKILQIVRLWIKILSGTNGQNLFLGAGGADIFLDWLHNHTKALPILPRTHISK